MNLRAPHRPAATPIADVGEAACLRALRAAGSRLRTARDAGSEHLLLQGRHIALIGHSESDRRTRELIAAAKALGARVSVLPSARAGDAARGPGDAGVAGASGTPVNPATPATPVTRDEAGAQGPGVAGDAGPSTADLRLLGRLYDALDCNCADTAWLARVAADSGLPVTALVAAGSPCARLLRRVADELCPADDTTGRRRQSALEAGLLASIGRRAP